MTGAPYAGERILVLGAGRHQVPLIKAAKAGGAEVVTSDYLPDAPGRALADFPVLGDTLDSEVNLAIARQYEVTAVTTIGTDQALPAVADVAEGCGLPCHLTPEGARAATNKVHMKRVLADHGVPVAAHVVVPRHGTDDVLGALTPPLVVKPADAQGQRATCVVTDPRALRVAVEEAQAASREGTAVVEEFLVGPEVTANAWVSGGEVHLLGVLDRVTYNPAPRLGIALRHVYPGVHAEGSYGEVGEILNRVAAAYQMREGPLYVQMIVGEDGIRVVEGSARVGGGHEPALFRHTHGVDLVELTLTLCLGRPNRGLGFDIRRDRPLRHGIVNFVVAHEGELSTFSPVEGGAAGQHVTEGGWYHQPGFRQNRVVDGQGRIGWFVVTGSSRSSVVERADGVYAGLEVRDPSGANLVYWPDPAELSGAEPVVGSRASADERPLAR